MTTSNKFSEALALARLVSEETGAGLESVLEALCAEARGLGTAGDKAQQRACLEEKLMPVHTFHEERTALEEALSEHIDAYMDGLITHEEMRQKMIIEAQDFLMALLKEPS